MTDFDRIITSSPVNAQAARQLGKGINWTPIPNIDNAFRDVLPVHPRDYVAQMAAPNKEFTDFTGITRDRLTVIGLWATDRNPNRPASWVCRCACGLYCTQKSKSLRQGTINPLMCGQCNYVQSLRSEKLTGMKNHKAAK